MVRGIDKHQTEYPDYTGDDFLELDGKPFNYNKDELNEFKEWDVTLEDGLDDETPLSELEFETTTTDEPVVEQQFRGTAVPTVPFQGSHRVTLTMNRAETAPIIFTPEMLREIKQREDTMWGRNNNDNPGDTNTTGENLNTTTNTSTDETTS
jgi:hypothetical protein